MSSFLFFSKFFASLTFIVSIKLFFIIKKVSTGLVFVSASIWIARAPFAHWPGASFTSFQKDVFSCDLLPAFDKKYKVTKKINFRTKRFIRHQDTPQC